MKANIKQIVKSQSAFGFELSDSSDLIQSIKELKTRMNELYSIDDLNMCSGCKCMVPDYDPNNNIIDECPFCGAEFEFEEEEVEEEEVEEEEVEEEENPIVNQISTEEINYTIEEEQEVISEYTPEEGNNDNMKIAKKRNYKKADIDIVVPEVIPVPVETNITIPKVIPVPLETNIIIPKVITAESSITDQKEELQKVVNRINILKTEMINNMYDLGEELMNVTENMLWKCKYDSFKEFCENEISMSKSWVYKLVGNVSKFPREIYLNLGMKKADLIGRLPEGKREEITQKTIDENLSFLQLKELLDSSKKSNSDNSKEKERKEKKESVKKEENKENKDTTILNRVSDEDVVIPWVSSTTHKQIVDKSENDKYAIFNVSEEVELVIMECEDGVSLTCTYREK